MLKKKLVWESLKHSYELKASRFLNFGFAFHHQPSTIKLTVPCH